MNAELPVNILGNIVHSFDEINFRCTRCGECCANRDSDLGAIILTSVDLYRIARFLGFRSTASLIENGYVNLVTHDETKFPYAIIDFDLSGKCIFCEENKCSIHDSKPVVCELYPLARGIDAHQSEFTYYWPPHNHCSGCGAGTYQSLTDWIQCSSFSGYNEWYRAYEAAKSICLTEYNLISNTFYLRKAYVRAIQAFYFGFNTQKPFLPQLKENVHVLRVFLQFAMRKSFDDHFTLSERILNFLFNESPIDPETVGF